MHGVLNQSSQSIALYHAQNEAVTARRHDEGQCGVLVWHERNTSLHFFFFFRGRLNAVLGAVVRLLGIRAIQAGLGGPGTMDVNSASVLP
jgi:hypothetical protein